MRRISKDTLQGNTGNAFLLTAVKVVTMILSLLITRMLATHLSTYEYGTYAEILLVISTVSSLTILGMVDGVNYFFFREQDHKKREEYISTIYFLQTVISIAAGIVILILTGILVMYFDNPGIRKYMVFAAGIPLLQNMLSVTHVLMVSVGKARILAMRNLLVSVVQVAVVGALVHFSLHIGYVFTATVVLDILQILWFFTMLKRENCHIRFLSVRPGLAKSILRYCIPMAVFLIMDTINRDCDKYVVALLTDTETMAIYANASKMLPFNIIAGSFVTVMVPKITGMIVGTRDQAEDAYLLETHKTIGTKERNREIIEMYGSLLEIIYISTIIMAASAVVVAPQLMTLLYSEKYLQGTSVFIVYTVVAMVQFATITLLLSAAGRTKVLMYVAVVEVIINITLNIILFHFLGIIGPALATLVVTIGAGCSIMHFGGKLLGIPAWGFFDIKYAVGFLLEIISCGVVMIGLRHVLEATDLHYFLIIVICCGIYGTVLGLMNRKRIRKNLHKVN